MSSSDSHATITYTFISSDFDLPPWRFKWVFDAEPQSPEAAPQSPEQAPPSPNYVLGLEYLKYVAPSDDEISVEDQPLPMDASPIALSLGYVADSNPEDDLEKDPADYPADRGDDEDEDEESSKDDDDEEEEEFYKEDAEEEHLAPADSAALLTIDPVPLAEEIKPFETD
ncbi:hypothetical protein Tco_1120019 [Tanacetum coccineum]|uniref:Uncharacterized protein n=1 Tax=Tanacetum coccineum TaxID=301880 RepID=A0ABQ4ZHY2_9ASTR